METTDNEAYFALNRPGYSRMEIFEALYQPPRKPCLRIIIWNYHLSGANNILIEMLGVVLHIEPQLFQALCADSFSDSVELRPLEAGFVTIGGLLITSGQYKVRDNSLTSYLFITNPNIWKLQDSLMQDVYRYHSSENVETMQNEEGSYVGLDTDVSRPRDRMTRWVKLYMYLLRKTLTEIKAHEDRIDDLAFIATLPVLRMTSLDIRERSRALRAAAHFDRAQYATPFQLYANETSVLYWVRVGLRRWVENAEDAVDQLRRIFRQRHKPEWLQHEAYQQIEREYRHVIAQAHRLETEVRDLIQIHSGGLAPEETKKSIELSNSQIQESRRGK